MDSEALATFVAVAHVGGFSSAAAVLHRSQPAISRRIGQLEADLGVTLFDRIGAGVVLSDAGRALLPHAERVAAAVQDAARAMGELQTEPAGPVALAAVGTLAGAGLTTVLRGFAARCPKAQLSLCTGTSAEVSDLVRRGEATLGLRYFADPSADLDSRPIAAERLLVACAPDHRLAGRGVASLVELREETWLAFPSAHAWREGTSANIFAQFLARGVAQVRWTGVDSLTAQKRLIEAGFGLALLPASAVEEELARGSLAVLAVRDLDVANPVVAVTRRGGYLSRAGRTLLEILEADFRA